MNRFLITLLVALVAFSAVARASEDDSHDEHGHDEHDDHADCACEAQKYFFTIDCNHTGAIQAAYDAALSCTSCEEGSLCYRQYLVVQAHHDHCAEDVLPTAIERGFHELEEMCGEGCHINAAFDPSLMPCPTVTCEDQTTADAQTTAAMTACDADCNSSACVSAFQQIVAYHDTCEGEYVSDVLQNTLHDLEDACPEITHCNAASGPFDPNVCDEPTTVAPTAAPVLSATTKGDEYDESVDIAILAIGIINLVFLALLTAFVVTRKNSALASKAPVKFDNPVFNT